jgi:hypothetical protein
VTIYELLGTAQDLLRRQWRATQPPENEKIYYHIQDAGFYIWRTGQIYRFEEYLERPPADRSAAVEVFLRGEDSEYSGRAVRILSQIRDSLPSEEERRLFQVIIDRFGFIASTGQRDEFSDYLKTFNKGPHPVIAHFDTREEAETWLANLREPPSSAYILIGDEYYEVIYVRDRGVRAINRDYALERFIENTTSRGLPVPAATFNTLAEAEAWWARQPDLPHAVYVQIAGEHHLAVHHRKIARRTLHPISILKGWEEEKKRIDAMEPEQEEADDDSDPEE